jgi:tetratricopeptide (TPR) repeat protein
MGHHAEPLIKQAYNARRAGDHAASLELYRKAAEEAVDDPIYRAHCLRHIGDLEREGGRVAEAQAALREAEALYRSVVSDPLSLANTIRLRALTEGSAALWREARILYQEASTLTGVDLHPALNECDAYLSR